MSISDVRFYRIYIGVVQRARLHNIIILHVIKFDSDDVALAIATESLQNLDRYYFIFKQNKALQE